MEEVVTQLDPSAHGVNILTHVRLSQLSDQIYLIVAQLRWSDSGEPPTLQVLNTVEDLPEEYSDRRGLSLEGNLVIVDSVENIMVWNWSTRSIVEIDSTGQSWSTPEGFHLLVQPPYLVVIPCNLQSVVYLRIPEGPPGGQTVRPIPRIPPTEMVQHVFMRGEPTDLGWSALHNLATFVPASLRPAHVGYLRITHIWGEESEKLSLALIIRFSRENLPHEAPRIAKQTWKRFARMKYHYHFATAPFFNNTLSVLSYPRHMPSKLAGRKTSLCTVRMFPFEPGRRGNFTAPTERTFEIEPHEVSESDFDHPWALCPVSGVGMKASNNTAYGSGDTVIGVIRFR